MRLDGTLRMAACPSTRAAANLRRAACGTELRPAVFAFPLRRQGARALWPEMATALDPRSGNLALQFAEPGGKGGRSTPVEGESRFGQHR